MPDEDEDWYCMRCKFLLSSPENHPASAICYFCNDLTGIMMCDKNMKWCHYTCVNWIPDIWFADEAKTTIDGRLDPDRMK